MFSGSDLEEYRKDLNDFKALTEMTPDRIVLWFVDAQTTFLAADEYSWLIGGNTLQEFVLLWYSFWCIRLLNTWEFGSIYLWDLWLLDEMRGPLLSCCVES